MKLRKLISKVLVVVMILTTVLSGQVFNFDKANAAEMPESVKMPIVIYDHLPDDMLFEYNMDDPEAMKFDMWNAYFSGSESEASKGKGLVESDLGAFDTPIYKQDTVEKLAKLTQDYVMNNNSDGKTDRFKQIYNQLVGNEKNDYLFGGTETLEERGWTFNNGTLKAVSDNATPEVGTKTARVDANGNAIWWQFGAELRCAGGSQNVAEFAMGEIEAGSYRFVAGPVTNVNVRITDGTTDYLNFDGTGAGVDNLFTVPATANLKLVITAKDDASGAPLKGTIIDPRIDTDSPRVVDYFGYKMMALDTYKTALDAGWVIPDGSLWDVTSDGAVINYKTGTTEYNKGAGIYGEKDVTAGKTYKLTYGNLNNLCSVTVTAANGTKVGQQIAKTDAGTSVEFTVPADCTKVRIIVDCTVDAAASFSKPVFSYVPEMGTYEASKQKFDVEHKKLADISTCMDYAYYMLNNLWTDTQSDINQKTNAYKTITLDRITDANGDQYYNFESVQDEATGRQVVYDIENQNIYANSNIEKPIGFFPIDKNVLGATTDLTAPYGQQEFTSATIGTHNYHYAMKAHCQFVYTESAELFFDFLGDDDVYLFIDGKLVLDIGGAHKSLGQRVVLNDLKDELGLIDGEKYSFDFFYLERHTEFSNLRINTNFKFEPVEAIPNIVFTDEENNEITADEVTVGETVNITYEVTAGNDGTTNISFEDDLLGITVGQEGLKVSDKVKIEDKITVTKYDENGIPVTSFSISKEDINNPAEVEKFLDNFGIKGDDTDNGIVLDKGEKLVVTGFSHTMDYDKFETSLDVSVTAPINVYDSHGNLVEVQDEVAVIPVTKEVIPSNTANAELELTFYEGNNVITLDGNKKAYRNKGTEVEVVYTLTSKSIDMQNITIKDSKLGVTVGEDGLTLGSSVYVKDKITVTKYDKDGNSVASVIINKDDLNNSAVVNAFTSWFGDASVDNETTGLQLDSGEYIVVEGIYHTLASADLVSNVTADITAPIPSVNAAGNVVVTQTPVTGLYAEGTVEPKVKVTFTTDGNGSLTGTTKYDVVKNTMVGTKPAEEANTGYQFDKWTKTVNGTTTTVADPATEVIAADTVFTAVYKKLQYTYSIEYVDEDGNELAATDANLPAEHGDTVNPKAKTVEGYTPKQNSQSVVIDKDKMVITFVYTKNNYDVKFKTDGNGKLEGTTDYTVEYKDKVPAVPTKTPNEDYSFVNWTMTVNGTTTEVTDPGAVEITADTVFTANFSKLPSYDYVVKYVDEDGVELLKSDTGSQIVNKKVTVQAKPINEYVVDENEKSLVVTSDESTNVIIFVYTKLHDVTFTTDGNGTLEGTTDYVVKNKKTTGTKPEKTANTGYEFVKWTKTVGGVTTDVTDPATEVITADTVFTAVFKKLQYKYSVEYVDEYGNELAATDANLTAEHGDVVNPKAKTVEGYTPKQDSQSVVIDKDNMVITFVYTKNNYDVLFTTDGNGTLEGTTSYKVDYKDKVPAVPTKTPNEDYKFVNWTMTVNGNTTEVTDPGAVEITDNTVFTANFSKLPSYDYVVKYVDEDGNNLLDPDTGSQIVNKKVTVQAKPINEYVVDENEKSLVVTSDESTNVIIFVYTKLHDVTFTTDGNGTLDGKTDYVVKNKETTGNKPVEEANTGYEFVKWTKTVNGVTTDVADPATEVITADTVFTAVFKKLQYKYSVEYVDEDGNQLADTDVDLPAEHGDTVKPKAKTVEGYTPKQNSQEVVIDKDNMVITFVYTKNNYDVTFTTDGNGTLEGTTEYKVDYKDKVPAVPTDVPNEDYKFVNWTMTVNGTTTEVVNPADVEITDNTVFTANFSKLPSYNYVVKYVDEDGKDLLDPETGSQIVNKKVTVQAKSINEYVVDENEKSVVVTSDESTNVIIFVYTKLHDVTFTTDGNGTLEGTTDYVVKNKETTGNKPEKTANTGYEFVKWTMTVGETTTDVEDPATEVITADTVFTAVFKKLQYKYSVEYVDEEGNQLADTDVDLPAEHGDTVKPTAKEVEGYTPAQESQEVVIDKDNMVITFVYSKNAYNVKFTTDGNGTLEGTTDYTVKFKEKVPGVPTQTPNANFEFVKWTMTVNGTTTDVADPAAVEITVDTVFTAIYKEVPTTTEPETEAPTTPETEVPTTEAPTTEAPTTEAPTVSSGTVQPVTGYARNTLFVVIALGLFAAMGGAILLFTEKKSRA